MLAPWKKSYDQPREYIKKQRHYFAKKGPSNQSYCFSNSYVWMWELNYKKSWEPKNLCFQIVVLGNTLESPLVCKEIQPVQTGLDTRSNPASNWVPNYRFHILFNRFMCNKHLNSWKSYICFPRFLIKNFKNLETLLWSNVLHTTLWDVCMHAKLLQSCLTLCDTMDCSPPGSSVLRIFQVRILEWVAMPSSRGSSWPRNRTCIS